MANVKGTDPLAWNIIHATNKDVLYYTWLRVKIWVFYFIIGSRQMGFLEKVQA